MKELPTFMLTMTRKNHALKTIVDSKSTFAFYQMQVRHQFQAIFLIMRTVLLLTELFTIILFLVMQKRVIVLFKKNLLIYY